MQTVALSVIAVILILMIWLIVIYNGLVRQKNQAKNAFAQIDVQLKRRHDLIPNLVNAAARYLTHEQDTLQQVTQARNHATQVQSVVSDVDKLDNPAWLTSLAQAQNQLTQALGGLYVVMESYPEIKADNIIRQVIDELTNTENRIGFARQHYNDSVMHYNNSREVFPNSLISSSFNFRPMNLLQFADKAQIDVAPVVNFIR